MAATAYRGFQYEMIGDGRWRITLPSRLKSVVEVDTEADLRAMIDDLATEMGV